jgi:hypothetical protein
VSEKDMTADQRVTAWILRQYREESRWKPRPERAHLMACDEVEVADASAFDSVYGCDTGCEYARLEADVRCAHGFADSFEYGTWGELPELLLELERALSDT